MKSTKARPKPPTVPWPEGWDHPHAGPPHPVSARDAIRYQCWAIDRVNEAEARARAAAAAESRPCTFEVDMRAFHRSILAACVAAGLVDDPGYLPDSHVTDHVALAHIGHPRRLAGAVAEHLAALEAAARQAKGGVG